MVKRGKPSSQGIYIGIYMFIKKGAFGMGMSSMGRADCCPGWMAGLCWVMCAFQESYLPLAPWSLLRSPPEVGHRVPFRPGVD